MNKILIAFLAVFVAANSAEAKPEKNTEERRNKRNICST